MAIDYEQNLQELPYNEWQILYKKDSAKLTFQEIFLRDLPLLKASKNGDLESWTQLWLLYKKGILRKINVYFWDIDVAADIFQDLYLKAFNKLNTYDLNKSFFPWIQQVIKNSACNYFKHNNIVKMINAGTMKEKELYNLKDEIRIRNFSLEDYKVKTPRDNFSTLKTSMNIRKCLKELPEKHQEILKLRYIESYSYKELAELLDIPMGTVMSRLFNAKAELLYVWRKNIK